MELIDRFIVLKLLGEEQAGIYSFGYRIALIYNLFILSFKSAWIPHYFHLKEIDEIEKSKHLSRVLTKLVFISSIIILSIQIGTKILFDISFNSFQFFDPSYKSSEEFIFYVMTGYFFSLMMAFYSIAPYKFNKTIHFLIADLLAMISNLILNLILVRQLGIKGAAIATMISFMIGAIYLSIYHHSRIKLEYETKKLFLILIITFLAFLSLEMFDNIFTSISLVCVLVILGIKLKLINKNYRNVFSFDS